MKFNYKRKSFLSFKLLLVLFGIILIGSNINLLFCKLIIVNNKHRPFNNSFSTAEAGEQLNVTLHQSYYSTTPIEFMNLSNSNEFPLPCPTEPTFNSSYTEFQIEDISAPSKSLVIEKDTVLTQTLFDSADNKFAFSFQVVNSCYLEEFSFCFTEDDSQHIDGELQVNLRTAEINGSNIVPASFIHKTLNLTFFIDDDISETWFNFTGYHEYLNTELTTNNTFFITLRQKSDTTQTRIKFHYMHDALGDLIDNSLVYESDGGDWILRDFDASMVVNVTPVTDTPKPSQINMKVNDTNVSDNVDNSGFWISNEEYTNPSGLLEFGLSADWWDVSCDIAKAQINYTKTDLKASTNFVIPEPGLVLWNASIDEPIDSYDSRIDDYNYITFWVPENWSDIKGFSGSIEKPVDISASALNGYRQVVVFQAGNGDNWYLTASIDNRTPGNGGTTIPFGNYYLLFTIIVLVSLIFFTKRKSIKKKKMCKTV